MWSARPGRKSAMYHMRPRNTWTSVANLGTGQFMMWLTFFASGLIPWQEMWWPRKSTSVQNKLLFLTEQYRFVFRRASSTSLTFCLCSAKLSDQIITSSRYTWQILLINFRNAEKTQCWWTAREFWRPMYLSHWQKGIFLGWVCKFSCSLSKFVQHLHYCMETEWISDLHRLAHVWLQNHICVSLVLHSQVWGGQLLMHWIPDGKTAAEQDPSLPTHCY